MRSKSILLLALALGCGLVASIGVTQILDKNHAVAPEAGPMEPIFVASANINYNEEITPDKVRLQEWPKDKVQKGALTKIEDVIGKRSATLILEDEPILAGKLMGADGLPGAAGKIPKGYRVVSVQVDAVTGASSLILPNDRVDVLVYMSRNEAAGVLETSAKTILQDVRVFAVDTQFERQHGKDAPAVMAKTISLLVTPEQAERITLATEMGKLRLVMRSPDDSSDSVANGAGVSDILGQGVVQQPVAATQEKSSTQSPDALAQLNQMKEQKAAAPAEDTSSSWHMTLVEGGTLRQVELTGDGKFPGVNAPPDEYVPDDFTPATPPAAPADALPPEDDTPVNPPATEGDLDPGGT